jgi:hypothetical protein
LIPASILIGFFESTACWTNEGDIRDILAFDGELGQIKTENDPPPLKAMADMPGVVIPAPNLIIASS